MTPETRIAVGRVHGRGAVVGVDIIPDGEELNPVLWHDRGHTTFVWEEVSYEQFQQITMEDVMAIMDKQNRVGNKDLAHLFSALGQSLLSKDPSTKVGALVLDALGQVAGTGYNGFARGVPDLPAFYADRETKYQLARHAEANAVAVAGASARGGTLYSTHPPCSHCASDAVHAGIRRVVYVEPAWEFGDRWGASMRWAQWQFDETRVEVVTGSKEAFMAFVRGVTT
jgi:dCMP deaminase